MARHYIYPNPNPNGTNADRRIELSWQRDLCVAVATTGWQGEPGKPDTAVEHLLGPGFPAPRAWAGEVVELTRDQINHLIKQLRVARDQAYGRDE
jgi:hypothetical protein